MWELGYAGCHPGRNAALRKEGEARLFGTDQVMGIAVDPSLAKARRCRPGAASGWFTPTGALPGGPPTGFTSCSLREELDYRLRNREAFVLLDDQAQDRSVLLSQPDRIHVAWTPTELAALLPRLDERLQSGEVCLAGFIGYSAGQAFDRLDTRNRPVPDGAGHLPVAWFAELAERQIVPGGIEPTQQQRVEFRPAVSRVDYEGMVAAALDRIGAGDLYQVNLTLPLLFDVADPVCLFQTTRRRARAPFGAFVHTGEHSVLSFSPELFFRSGKGRIEARPMKGTRHRGDHDLADAALADELISSEKDRAENLMIVDLLRNDISRIAVPGSVQVPRLFDVEPYPTVWQMTSTVEAELREGVGSLDILAAMFPCGSITGAPKIMATQVIADLEQFDRGIYTGSVGLMDADSAVFNVAIRTVQESNGRARIDVGAGIVADSDPHQEWLECRDKARFLKAGLN